MTRFGEISPLWQKLRNVWQYLKVYLVFGKVVKPLWDNFYSSGKNIFIVVNGQILKKLSDHLVTLSECFCKENNSSMKKIKATSKHCT